jgi:AcrR family transcriptional regulator
MSPRRTAEEAAGTRAALVAAARRLFTAPGFAAATLDDVARQAGVTRGALYHHFADKEALFAAVFEQIQIELAMRSGVAARRATSRIDGLVRGCLAFLDACLEPDVVRIMLADAPAVLGWDAWREIDLRHTLGPTIVAVRAAMDAGEMVRASPEAVADVIAGALTQAGMVIGSSARPAVERRQFAVVVRHLVEGLAIDQRSG